VLTKLHHANQMEIEAGKLAQEKGSSKEVKDYGKLLVKDHTAADKQVTALAKQLKVEFETMPEMKNAKLESAKAATGPEFDKTFAEAMVEDHTRDINETAAARDAATNPKLKKLLAGLVPKLEKHREVAQKIVAKSATGADTAAGAPGQGAGTGASAGSPPPTKAK
jgi:putative membrane protein